MTGWFRSWHGAPTDHKWLVVARKAETVPGIVAAIVWALFDHASQQGDRGDVRDFDVETYAAASGFEEKLIHKVISALLDKGIISDGRLTAWEKRQPKREDDSSARVAAHRQRNAPERDVTQRNAPDTDTDTDTEQIQKQSFSYEKRARGTEFDETFWPRYPHKVGRLKALVSFCAARKLASLEAIMAGLERYIASKPPDRQWLNPATFLNQGRWEDQPAVEIENGRAPKRTTADFARELSQQLRERERHDGHPLPAPVLISRTG